MNICVIIHAGTRVKKVKSSLYKETNECKSGEILSTSFFVNDANTWFFKGGGGGEVKMKTMTNKNENLNLFLFLEWIWYT